ncbi:hypothetical protein Fmac_017566 [Flemingia macrophylla]|uniref:ZF-HD dimerization-type domain-containing protein n=1 Tax=Flemingia macrophylla TaxID=520843 RepID=A0ABD1M2G3_9FABA
MRKRTAGVGRDDQPPPRSSNNSNLRTVTTVTYGECQKNQALHLGGSCMDGCGEFMASGPEGSASAMICAACGCHRSFHKRIVSVQLVCDCSYSPTTSGSSRV